VDSRGRLLVGSQLASTISCNEKIPYYGSTRPMSDGLRPTEMESRSIESTEVRNMNLTFRVTIPKSALDRLRSVYDLSRDDVTLLADLLETELEMVYGEHVSVEKVE